MKLLLTYAPLESEKGIPLLSQNRQFQWFKNPSFLFPVVMAQAASLLKKEGFEVFWLDGIAEKMSYKDWLEKVKEVSPDLLVLETKTPVVKKHLEIIKQLKLKNSKLKTVLLGDHVTANTPFPFRLSGYLGTSKFAVGFANVRHVDTVPEKKAKEHFLVLANTFIRKSVFEKYGGFDKDQVPCEENYLYSKIDQGGHLMLYVPKIACLHPAKPIFLPWAQKMFFYSTGRGSMVARAPKTFAIQYLIPTIFIFSLIVLPIVSFFYHPAVYLLLAILLFHSFLNLINSIYLFLKFEKNILIVFTAPPATFLLHAAYGLGFVNGLLHYLIGNGKAVKMPNKF